jgi:Flp pilus assembly protein TadD
MTELPMTPEQVDFLYAVGHGYLAKGHYNRALDTFAVLAARVHRDPRVWCALGSTLQALGRLEGALAAYSLGAALAPDDALIALNRAEVLVLLGNSRTARSILESVSVSESRDPLANARKHQVQGLVARAT